MFQWFAALIVWPLTICHLYLCLLTLHFLVWRLRTLTINNSMTQPALPLKSNYQITSALCCMEDGCMGYPQASSVTSRALDSIPLPWLAIPATQPWAPTDGYPGTHHSSKWNKSGKGMRREGQKKKGKITSSLIMPCLNTPLPWGAMCLHQQPEIADHLTSVVH